MSLTAGNKILDDDCGATGNAWPFDTTTDLPPAPVNQNSEILPLPSFSVLALAGC